MEESPAKTQKITPLSILAGLLILAAWAYGNYALSTAGQNHELGLQILMCIGLGVFIGPVLMIKRRRGLGLLLILLGLFEAMTMPSKFLSGHREDVSVCKTNLKEIGTAAERYMLDHQGETYDDTALVPQYLESFPTCPAARKPTYTVEFGKEGKPGYYLITCSGAHHEGVDLPPDYPRFDEEVGLIIP